MELGGGRRRRSLARQADDDADVVTTKRRTRSSVRMGSAESAEELDRGKHGQRQVRQSVTPTPETVAVSSSEAAEQCAAEPPHGHSDDGGVTATVSEDVEDVPKTDDKSRCTDAVDDLETKPSTEDFGYR